MYITKDTVVVAPARDDAGGRVDGERVRRVLQRHGRVLAHPRRTRRLSEGQGHVHEAVAHARTIRAEGVLEDDREGAYGMWIRYSYSNPCTVDPGASADREVALEGQSGRIDGGRHQREQRCGHLQFTLVSTLLHVCCLIVKVTFAGSTIDSRRSSC